MKTRDKHMSIQSKLLIYKQSLFSIASYRIDFSRLDINF